MSKPNINPITQLENIIEDTVAHIHDFTKSDKDFTRNRKLNATDTIKVTLNMEGQSLNTEMIHAFPNMNERMTASAYEQQKEKLTPELFLHILKEYNATAHTESLFMDKYELYAVDGSDFNLPYQSKSKYVITYHTNKRRNDGETVKPYSQLHGNLLFNITNRTYENIVMQTYLKQDERSAAIDMLSDLHPKNPYIVIMDRGYDGFNMIEHCNRLNGNGYYVIRTKAGEGGNREITNLPNEECDVDMEFKITTSSSLYAKNKDIKNLHLINSPKRTYKKYLSPNTKYQRWDFGQFETVKCRVVKFRINNADSGKEEWEVLLTNLDRFEFPVQKMKELYHIRWDIETSFRELKYALGAVQFHSRKDNFVEMELIAHLIMFNVVSRTISAVSVPQSAKKKYRYVVSFKDCVTLLRKYYRLFCIEPPDNIYAELLGYTRPLVSGRADKRKMKPKSAVWFVYRVA